MYKNGLYGAIIGDICGSKLEISEMRNRKNEPDIMERLTVLDEDYPLITDDLFYTDDTVLTTAISDAILHDCDYEKYIKNYGLREINSTKNGERNKFGQYFTDWCNGSGLNNSYGNGCAMRISPIAFSAKTMKQLEKHVIKATVCTHDHPDSIKCTMALAKAIFLAKSEYSKEEIQKIVEETLGFELDFDFDKIRAEHKFSSKAIVSVPLAIACFLASKDFESTLRLTLSLGGDTDTNCAIACSLAGAFYGISEKAVKRFEKFLPKKYAEVLDELNTLLTESYNENIHDMR